MDERSTWLDECELFPGESGGDGGEGADAKDHHQGESEDTCNT